MTREDRLRLIRAPICTGILASQSHGGVAAGGHDIEGFQPRVGVLNPRTGAFTGRMISPTPRTP